ncbi:NmrA family NAD(P)-binding protein [Streptomyces sp. NPDC088341]|uniref:NmrA family NAD(P)-binding protein n=1 Tax=Streptomyces sp. NPDC088341 TaxID=3154870 RepID=UPI00341A159A
MNDAPFLITGAAGGIQGSTGLRVARKLLDDGHPVRALVHRLDERSVRLEELGADVVQADYHDHKSLVAALAGVRRAYFTYPVQEGLLEATTRFAAVAREAGVERVVNMSQWLRPGGVQPSPHQARHWLAEQALNWADLGVVHIGATVFYENVMAFAQLGLSRDGSFTLPWGPPETALPFVAAEDVAHVAAAVLTGPAMPNGTVVQLSAGGRTCAEISDLLGDVVGLPVPYRECTDEEWAQVASEVGINAAAVEHLGHMWQFLRTRPSGYEALRPTTEVFERFLGRRPQSLEHFLQNQAGSFQR